MSWHYLDNSGTFVPYDDELNDDIEKAHAKKKDSVDITIKGTEYVIDFKSNAQYQKENPKKKRRIKRKGDSDDTDELEHSDEDTGKADDDAAQKKSKKKRPKLSEKDWMQVCLCHHQINASIVPLLLDTVELLGTLAGQNVQPLNFNSYKEFWKKAKVQKTEYSSADKYKLHEQFKKGVDKQTDLYKKIKQWYKSVYDAIILQRKIAEYINSPKGPPAMYNSQPGISHPPFGNYPPGGIPPQSSNLYSPMPMQSYSQISGPPPVYAPAPQHMLFNTQIPTGNPKQNFPGVDQSQLSSPNFQPFIKQPNPSLSPTLPSRQLDSRDNTPSAPPPTNQAAYLPSPQYTVNNPPESPPD